MSPLQFLEHSWPLLALCWLAVRAALILVHVCDLPRVLQSVVRALERDPNCTAHRPKQLTELFGAGLT